MGVRGVCERALKLPRAWEGYAVIIPRPHWLPTGLGKADRPGGEGGVRKRELWGNEEPTSPIERARIGNSPPKATCAALLPDACESLNTRTEFLAFLYRSTSP